VSPVDCATIQPIQPVNVGKLKSIDDPYFVSFSWWDGRVRDPSFAAGLPIEANDSVYSIQRLIGNTTGAFVDIGANVGFMTMYGINKRRPVYAVDPISYDIAKLCEGLAANVEKGLATMSDNNLHLYHAAAGPVYQQTINITRPSDKVGLFDQSSLTREAVLQGDVTTEQIPMITVDSIIPADMPIGVVKIDVQGHEFGVLSGMKEILSRTTGYPIHVFYEDAPEITKAAGNIPGACESLLREHGYQCTHLSGDILCSKY